MKSKKVFLTIIGLTILAGLFYLPKRTKNIVEITKSIGNSEISPKKDVIPEEVMTNNMNISSSSFDQNGLIPAKYTCDGKNISPQLSFSNIPENTISLALIVDDPDAPGGDWVHWLLWNIDPKTSEVKEGGVPEGAVQGLTDFGNNNYGGPCPPSGVHRYQFKLYALDTNLNLSENSKKSDLEKAIDGHIIDQTVSVGLYQK